MRCWVRKEMTDAHGRGGRRQHSKLELELVVAHLNLVGRSRWPPHDDVLPLNVAVLLHSYIMIIFA